MINIINVLKEMLISEKEFIDINYQRLKKTMSYIKDNFIDADGKLYLVVDSLREIRR